MHNMIIEDEHDVHANIENWRKAPTLEVEMLVYETTHFKNSFLSIGKSKIKKFTLHFIMHQLNICGSDMVI